MTKLLFIDDGIEFDSILLKKKPYGGAEVAFVSLVEALAKLNYEVFVYNNCLHEGKVNGVKWNKLDSRIFDEKFDVLIVNRGDKFLDFKKGCRKRIFWIHNPAKYLLKYRYLSKLFLNKFKIVFSSKYHYSTYPNWAPALEKIIIPYGVKKELFKKKTKAPKPIANFYFKSNARTRLVVGKLGKKNFSECKFCKIKFIYRIRDLWKIWVKT